MIVKVKKKYKGHVSVRDYLVEECIRNGEDLTVEYNDQLQVYPLRDLQEYLNKAPMQLFTSKYDGRQYNLVDLPW